MWALCFLSADVCVFDVFRWGLSVCWLSPWEPRTAASWEDGLQPVAVAGGLSVAHEPFGGCFDSEESCSVQGLVHHSSAESGRCVLFCFCFFFK